MKNSVSVDQISGLILTFFKRYHLILFTLTVVLGVSVAVFLLNQLMLAESGNDNTSSQASGAIFDEATIDRIKSLNTSADSGGELVFPDGRVDPFSE